MKPASHRSIQRAWMVRMSSQKKTDAISSAVENRTGAEFITNHVGGTAGQKGAPTEADALPQDSCCALILVR